MPKDSTEIKDEKKPTQSKKFIAFVINELTWKALIGIFLWVYSGQLGIMAMSIGMAMILTSGAIAIGYIINQGAIDKYVRIAKITANIGIKNSESVKDAIGQKVQSSLEAKEQASSEDD